MKSAGIYALTSLVWLIAQGAFAAPQTQKGVDAAAPSTGDGTSTSPYPADAIAAKHEGLVVVKTFVDTEGTASRATVEKSSGYPELDDAAKKMVTQHHFNPHVGKDGKPDSGYAIIPVKFALPPSKSS